MSGKSNVTLWGNITQDIEPRTTANGLTVASFTVAENHPNDEVSYIDCVAFGQPAEYLSKYAAKGQSVFVIGGLKQNRWEDKQGNKRSRLEVIARDVSLIGKRPDDRPLTQADVVSETYKDEVPTDVPDKIDLSEIPF